MNNFCKLPENHEYVLSHYAYQDIWYRCVKCGATMTQPCLPGEFVGKSHD